MMQIAVLGISHQYASFELCELFIQKLSPIYTSGALSDISPVFLATCNRVELYFSSNHVVQTSQLLSQELKKYLPAALEAALYCYFSHRCFFHLACVTAGLESVILGETEIQGQVKQAYRDASVHIQSSEMHFLFQKCLKIGKEVRMMHFFPKKNFHLEESIFALAEKMLGNLVKRSILFLGASTINRKIHVAFLKKGLTAMTFSNRTVPFCNPSSLQLPWEAQQQWVNYDIILSGIKALSPIIQPQHLTHINKTLVLFDLGLPRNIDQQVSAIPHIHLFDLQDMQEHLNYRSLNFFDQKKHTEQQKEIVAYHVTQQIKIFENKQQYMFSHTS